jgi:hypothetical protein
MDSRGTQSNVPPTSRRDSFRIHTGASDRLTINLRDIAGALESPRAAFGQDALVRLAVLRMP